MENLRTLKTICFVLGGALLVLPFFIRAYDDKTTHPALTQEIVKFFNAHYPVLALNDEGKELVVQGSIDEDSGIRWMHHFYDPVYNRGLVLEDETFPQDPSVAIIASGAKSQWSSSKKWAVDTQAQGGLNSLAAGIFKSYFSGENDFSWDRAIYEYVWGDKKRGLTALGHILHLLEDATVPDHTRNDAHPQILDFGSPYEFWTKKFDRASYRSPVAGNPILLANISTYFDTLANYSNSNFFSKDTIFTSQYSQPNDLGEETMLLSDGVNYRFGYKITPSGIKYYLIRIEKELGKFTSNYSLKDADNKILTDYWTLLSEQAVLHGAGAMKLFFDEVEKERQTKALYEKNRSWVGKQFDKAQAAYQGVETWTEEQINAIGNGLSNVAGIVTGLLPWGRSELQTPLETGSLAGQAQPVSPQTAAIETVVPNTLPAEIAEVSPPQGGEASTAGEIRPLPQAQPEVRPPVLPESVEVSLPQGRETSTVPQPPKPKNTSSIVPIMGAGSGQNPVSQEETPPPPFDTTPPDPPIITEPDADGKIFATTTLIFSGTAEIEALVTGNWLLDDGAATSTATTTDEAGNWLLVTNALPQGTSTINFFAKDAAGNESKISARTVFIDTLLPTVTLTVQECGQSLSQETCLLASQTLSLEWSSNADDLAHYSVSCETNGIDCAGFANGTTTATSTVYNAPDDNKTYAFSVKAIDTTGNQGTTATKTVVISTRPVVINEIAWAGTGSSPTTVKDEWAELYNPTETTINLEGIRFKSLTDSKPDIALSGTLRPGAYYLIERTSDDTIPDITASTTAAFGNGTGEGLVNSGEVLALVYGEKILDKTPTVAACKGWCGGFSSSAPYTMERYDPLAPGEAKPNWGSFAGFLATGTNFEGDAINGTPGQRNSVNYLIAHEGSLNKNKTLTKASSPYIVSNNFVVKGGAILTIEPGVVIKFFSPNTSLAVIGTSSLAAQGTAGDPIVFTSFKDDEYAGDTNKDGSTSSPQAGDWGAVRILADGSLLDYVLIRYGGRQDMSPAIHWANLRIEKASATVTNSVIEYSGTYGIWLKNSTSTIESNIVRENTVHSGIDSTGIVSEGGGSTIKNNTITKNIYGLRAVGYDAAKITGNSFTNNTASAIDVSAATPEFSGNSAVGNGANGIRFEGSAVRDHTLTPDLPYVFSTSFNIPAGRTLAVSAGTIVKLWGGSLSVNGKLEALGTAENKVVFTSFHDDECGDEVPDAVCGDADATTTAPMLGDWNTIFFNGGTASSTFTHAVIRYGGGISSELPGALRIAGTSIEIRNTVIEKNSPAGIWMQNSTSTLITDSIIRDHADETPNTVRAIMLVSSSTPTIANTAFSNNEENISADDTSSYIDGGGNSGL